MEPYVSARAGGGKSQEEALAHTRGAFAQGSFERTGVRKRHLTWLILVGNNPGREMVGSWAVLSLSALRLPCLGSISKRQLPRCPGDLHVQPMLRMDSIHLQCGIPFAGDQSVASP